VSDLLIVLHVIGWMMFLIMWIIIGGVRDSGLPDLWGGILIPLLFGYPILVGLAYLVAYGFMWAKSALA
jgi:hypothetical protein